MSWKGLSETPMHYISRYKGDSVSRYRRYRCDQWRTLGLPFDAKHQQQPQIFSRNLETMKRGDKAMKSFGDVEEDLAEKAEPVLGFKPSSKFKRGPIGILIYVLCGIVAFISIRSAGVF